VLDSLRSLKNKLDSAFLPLLSRERHMENFQLKVFAGWATHLNFSRAAKERLLMQPAVTQQI
jgi:hypothetical protein